MFILYNETENNLWSKQLNLYTIQMGQYRKLNGTDIELIDVTLKTKDPLAYKLFAPPSWELVQGVKNNTISEEEYTNAYVNKLKATSSLFLNEWFHYFDKGNIALSCFCGKNSFCHRHILLNFMSQLAHEYNYDVNIMGEV